MNQTQRDHFQADSFFRNVQFRNDQKAAADAFRKMEQEHAADKTLETLTNLIDAELANPNGELSPEFNAFIRHFGTDEGQPEDIRAAFSIIQRRIGFIIRHGDVNGKSRAAIDAAANLLAQRYADFS